jgi:hypothetical protein
MLMQAYGAVVTNWYLSKKIPHAHSGLTEGLLCGPSNEFITNPTRVCFVQGEITMQQQFIRGATMRVCGGNLEVHGFAIDELVKVIQVRPEPELSDVALCKSTFSGETAILLIDEVEEA